MRDAVMAHPAASELFRAGEAELVWRKTFATLRVQARTDWFNQAGCALCPRPYVVDLKTVESLDDGAFRNFEKAFVNLGYHRQAGFYLPLLYDCGIACTDFFFVAVEKCEPYGVAVYKVSNAALQRGQEETLRDLTRIKGCIESNRWPNMPEDVQEIDLPTWYKETWL
jgi:exodeoxyribonuclease VIII